MSFLKDLNCCEITTYSSSVILGQYLQTKVGALLVADSLSYQSEYIETSSVRIYSVSYQDKFELVESILIPVLALLHRSQDTESKCLQYLAIYQRVHRC
jgi:hypothetical protein